MQSKVHPERCTCETCFRKPWAIAGVISILQDLDVTEVEAFFATLKEAEKEPELVEATAWPALNSRGYDPLRRMFLD